MTIDAGTASRALYFHHATNALTETISYIRFVNGTVNNDSGGAIFVNGGSLTLSNCFFQSNIATYGGAVAVTNKTGDDTVTITDTQFRDNNAATGGALYIDSLDGTGAITIAGSGFTSNHANGAEGIAGVGGAIFTADPASGKVFTVSNTSFITNTAADSGGAIWTTHSLTVQATTGTSEFTQNTSGGGGGAIVWGSMNGQTTALSVKYVTFQSNSAVVGGAIYVGTNKDSGTATQSIVGCLFANNGAVQYVENTTNDGGALYVTNTTANTATAEFTLTNSTLYQNQASNNGGGIFINNVNTGTGTNKSTLTSLTVYDNTAGNEGGGLWLTAPAAGDRVRVRNSFIAGNNACTAGMDVWGTNILSTNYNFIGTYEGTPVTAWNAGTDQFGNDNARLTPDLDLAAGLDDWGGKTKTFKVLTQNNPNLYRKGDPTLPGAAGDLGKDQRGLARNQANQWCTIGAYDPDAA